MGHRNDPLLCCLHSNAVPGQHFLSALLRLPELQRQPPVKRLGAGGGWHRRLPDWQLFLCHHRGRGWGSGHGRQRVGESRLPVDVRRLHRQRGRGGVVQVGATHEGGSRQLGCDGGDKSGSKITGRPAVCTKGKEDWGDTAWRWGRWQSCRKACVLFQTGRPNPDSVVIYLLWPSPYQCAELQGFVRPLLELLNGLKRGRFDRGKHPCSAAFSRACARQTGSSSCQCLTWIIWSKRPQPDQVCLCAAACIDVVQSAACFKAALLRLTHRPTRVHQYHKVKVVPAHASVCVCWRFPRLAVQTLIALLCFWLTGLSSFQQSVAMDRIQRIVGVLQRPNSGWDFHVVPLTVLYFSACFHRAWHYI